MTILVELLASFDIEHPANRATELLLEFGSVAGVLAATPEALMRAASDVAPIAKLIPAIRAMMLHVLKGEIVGRPVLASGDALVDYLRVSLAGAHEEMLRVLFLNARNELLREEQSFPGSAYSVVVPARAIIKRALELGATAIILVHNHPSGDPTPSAEDVRATRALVAAAAPLDLVVHDHIIVAGTTWTSLKTCGLMASGDPRAKVVSIRQNAGPMERRS